MQIIWNCERGELQKSSEISPPVTSIYILIPPRFCWNCEQILLPIVKRFCRTVKKTICLLNMRPSKKDFKDFAEMRSMRRLAQGPSRGPYLCNTTTTCNNSETKQKSCFWQMTNLNQGLAKNFKQSFESCDRNWQSTIQLVSCVLWFVIYLLPVCDCALCLLISHCPAWRGGWPELQKVI